MVAPDIYDLSTVLRRRKVTIGEWLEYFELNTLEDFDTKGNRIAGEQGCSISELTKNEIVKFYEDKQHPQQEEEIKLPPDDTTVEPSVVVSSSPKKRAKAKNVV